MKMTELFPLKSFPLISLSQIEHAISSEFRLLFAEDTAKNALTETRRECFKPATTVITKSWFCTKFGSYNICAENWPEASTKRVEGQQATEHLFYKLSRNLAKL